MKVILLQDIKGTGKKEQIVEVSDGYARNYLLPRKLAKEATSEALNSLERSKGADKHREEVRRQQAEVLSRELKGKVIQLEVRGGDNGNCQQDGDHTAGEFTQHDAPPQSIYSVLMSVTLRDSRSYRMVTSILTSPTILSK